MLYSLPMPVTGKNEKVQEEGQEKDAYSVSFTNGAKEQLDELQRFFKASDATETVKLAISFLQRIKETEEKKAANEQK